MPSCKDCGKQLSVRDVIDENGYGECPDCTDPSDSETPLSPLCYKCHTSHQQQHELEEPTDAHGDS